MKKLWFLMAAGILSAGSAGHSAEKKMPKQLGKLLAMTPVDFRNAVSVRDDSMETSATFTTEQGFQEKRGLLGIIWNDLFLRAFIDKKSGRATFQLYARLRYVAPSWRFYRSANYETDTGLQSVETTKLGTDVDCQNSRLLGGCTYNEDVAFDVPEPLLRTIASKYSATTPGAWRIRFKAQAGQDTDDGLVPAEVAGLLIVDRRAKGTPLAG
jgi:hypothetical protein